MSEECTGILFLHSGLRLLLLSISHFHQLVIFLGCTSTLLQAQQEACAISPAF